MEEYQDYKLLLAKGSDKLSEKVKEHLEGGYVPYGSPVISNTLLGEDAEGNPRMLTLVGQAVVLPYED